MGSRRRVSVSAGRRKEEKSEVEGMEERDGV